MAIQTIKISDRGSVTSSNEINLIWLQKIFSNFFEKLEKTVIVPKEKKIHIIEIDYKNYKDFFPALNEKLNEECFIIIIGTYTPNKFNDIAAKETGDALEVLFKKNYTYLELPCNKDELEKVMCLYLFD